ncbi:MAG: hypothetical protein IPN86_16945 [Saprospiraceae bacterium]|nr:hypothetical protein [Saprospiraceae bacterium]
MKRNLNTKSFIFLLIFCSCLSAAYLEYNDPKSAILSDGHSFVEHYIKENTYLPEVKFVKELLRTIFNVVNA